MRRGETKGRRGQRVASVIRHLVSEALIVELNDPRMSFVVTVTGVDVSADMRFADVRVSVLGGPKEQEDCLRGIRHAHGRLQAKVAEALDMKFCPILRFHLDQSVKRSIAVSAIIRQALAEDEAARAERIRRGVESPDQAPPVPEESPPVVKEAGKGEADDLDEDLDELDEDLDELDEDLDELDEDEEEADGEGEDASDRKP
jgi:ribosome-binding factor A